MDASSRLALAGALGIAIVSCGGARVQDAREGARASAATASQPESSAAGDEASGPPRPKGPPPPTCPTKAAGAPSTAAKPALVLQDGHAGAVAHSQSIQDVVLSRDGKVLASGG